MWWETYEGWGVCVCEREREFNAGEDVEAQTFLHTACGLQIDITLGAVWQYGP